MQPLVVIAHEDPGTADALRHAVEAAAGWRAAVTGPGPVELAAALACGASVALVGCGLLGQLPDACAVPVLAVGDDGQPEDLRAALGAGARGLITWPDDAADLPDELLRLAPPGRSGPAAAGSVVVAVAGAQGGVGTTTLAIHLAGAWARWGLAPVLLADLAGGAGFRLDLDPEAPGWSVAAAMAEGPGATLQADAFSQPWPGLCVLPLPGLADEPAPQAPEAWAVGAVLGAARTSFGVTVVDVPPRAGEPGAAALQAADVLLAVGRPDTAGLHALEGMAATWSATGRDPGHCGLVVVAASPAAPVATREVRARFGDRMWAAIPSSPAELAAAAEDGTMLLDRSEDAAVQAMLALAHRIAPFPTPAARR